MLTSPSITLTFPYSEWAPSPLQLPADDRGTTSITYSSAPVTVFIHEVDGYSLTDGFAGLRRQCTTDGVLEPRQIYSRALGMPLELSYP